MMPDLIDATQPDQELIDALIATVNRHPHLKVGTVFGSIMVVASTCIHSPTLEQKPTSMAIKFLSQLAARFLAEPHLPKNKKSVLEMQ